MKLGSAAVLLLMVASAGAERQRFCYKRVGYTRKHVERGSQQQHQQGVSEGAACQQATRYKTEVVYRTERHCCAGYERAGRSVDACLPVCSRGCPQGEACTAPNRCECLEGHQRDSAGRCVAEEATTLAAHILSYASSLLHGVLWLAQQASDTAELTSFAHDGSLSARPAWVELSNSTELCRSSTELCPLPLRPPPLPLTLGGRRLATSPL